MARFPLPRTACAFIAAAAVFAAGCAATPPMPGAAELQKQVAATERAFARTMADRDHAAFVTFLADDTVFFTGPKPLRGKAQVAAGWKRFYERPDAPFSWEPADVEVLDSGTLAISSGPVRDAQGKLVGTFTSIWRQEAPGVWRVVFDKGNDACDCAKAP
jgi:ketosteroid isomerase-like protein